MDSSGANDSAPAPARAEPQRQQPGNTSATAPASGPTPGQTPSAAPIGMFGARETDRDRLAEDIEAAMRRLSVESQKLAHAFADRHDLHFTDFDALVNVMDAERNGTPLTPGELGVRLGLTSGATTAVIDRLERRGHVRRDRDPNDRRKIHIRYAEPGAAMAVQFFGGLRKSRNTVLDQFTDDDLSVVVRFLTGMTEVLGAHRATVENRPRAL